MNNKHQVGDLVCWLDGGYDFAVIGIIKNIKYIPTPFKKYKYQVEWSDEEGNVAEYPEAVITDLKEDLKLFLQDDSEEEAHGS